jgi:CubicO group peptidase (beta-lactamase class C family)
VNNIDAAWLARLDERLEGIRRDWQIPGMAVSLVKDGAAVMAKGYGVRVAGKPDAVDGDTLYSIGSCTKSFTAAALGILVDEGKLTWDDPVIKHLPDFAVADPWLTERITVRDALAHRLGLKRATPLYISLNFSQRELVQKMRDYETAAPFRSDFVYDNAQYTLAGALVEAISGMPWSQFVQTRIFDPLGMTRSRTRYLDTLALDNRAGGHTLANLDLVNVGSAMIGEVVEVPWQDIGYEPAGSIASSADDLSRWLIMLLNGGSYNGQQILSAKTVADLHSPQIVSVHPENSPFAPMAMLGSPTNFWTYGMGFYIIDYRGCKMVIGGGQIRAHNTLFVLFPALDFGCSILANTESTVAHIATAFVIADMLLGATDRDWNAEFLGAAAMLRQSADAEAQAAVAARKPGTQPSQALETRAGSYFSPLYDQITVQDGVLRYGSGYAGALEHWHDDTYLARWDDVSLTPSFVTFERGGVTIDGIGFFKRV